MWDSIFRALVALPGAPFLISAIVGAIIGLLSVGLVLGSALLACAADGCL